MRKIFSFFKLLFSLLALLLGISIILWVCYNEFIHKLSDYERPPLAGPFGVAPLMILVGLYWARCALNELRGK